jgi:hypothetical protein
MANKTISDLTAGTAPDGSEIPYGVQAGHSRRLTTAQVATLAADPASDDGGALGTAAKRWADLFLASGGVINWTRRS